MTLTSMPTPFIQTLIPHLPRYAEEEGDFYAVPRTALVDALCQLPQVDHAVAETVIALLETLLDTLAVLDTDYLQKGEWCFVSFPAQLLALSLLTAWGDPDSRFFAAHFWNTQGIANAKKEQQRDVLRTIETRRVEHHAQQAAQPVRTIYVAWSIIKLDGKILLYQREDTRKNYDVLAGDYGLVGGRLNQRDVAGAWQTPDLLAALQSADSPSMKAALPNTLQRELHEETGLEFGRHYQFKPWRCLKPYQQVQGSAPNHALTDYYFEVFQIKLTLEGYLFLQRQVRQDERLVWFTPQEMSPGQSAGHLPYLHALLADFGNDHLAFEAALSALPDSFGAGYLVDKPKYGVTLLLDTEKPVLAGVLGKEKPLGLVLTTRQTALLLGLAAHGRGFEFATIAENISFHPYGWLDVSNNQLLQAGLLELAAVCKGTDIGIESHKDGLFRLSVNPTMVYFDEKLFTFSVKSVDLNSVQTKIPAYISRAAFETAFGTVQEKTAKFKMTLEFANKLKRLATQPFSADNEIAVKIEDTYKKGLHKEDNFLLLGLRSLIRQEAGIVKFNLQYTTV
jgi:8-oxo-dGTP pyrophosphatase MutT (NUDIX family)